MLKLHPKPLTSTRAWLYLLLAVALIAFVIRIVYIFILPQELTFDEPFYNQLVTNILTGKGYTFDDSAYHTSVPLQPTSFQEPLYPLFLSIIYSIIVPNHLAARIIQTLLGAATVVFVALLASELSRKRLAGLIAGVIAAVYPPLIYFNRLLMTENLFVFLFVVALWFWIRTIRAPTLWRCFTTGILFGLCCLTRGMLLWFMPLLLILTLILNGQKRILHAAWLLIGLIVCISPWTIRNYMVHQAFVPITTKGGWNLYFYTYPSENVDFNGTRYDEVPVPDVENLTEVERERLFQRLGIENIRNQPDVVLRYAIIKLIDFWDARLDNDSAVLTLINVVAFYSVVAAGLLGSIRAVRQREVAPGYYLLWAVILFHTGMAMIFTGGGKARMPIEPVLLALTGGGAVVLFYGIVSRLPFQKRLAESVSIEVVQPTNQ